MNYDTFYNKIKDGGYENKMEYPDTFLRSKEPDLFVRMREAYMVEDGRLYMEFVTDARSYVEDEVDKTLTAKQWKAIFHKAWEDGHSSGYNDVLNHLSDLVDIVKVFLK